MARNKFTRKLQTYEALACLNGHFEAISHHVFDLEHMGFFQGPKMHVFQGLIRELQSQISHDVVDRMHALEDADMFEHGKVRIAWEHHLNPDRPPFNDKLPEQPISPEIPNPEVGVSS